MTTHNHTEATVPVLLDTSWVDHTRQRVAVEFDCGLCLDFGQLDGIGPCPACDPDGYADHIDALAMAARFDFDGEDPWPATGTGVA